MEQPPADRNQWESELNHDDIFWLERRGWPVLTDKEQRLFSRLEEWHQAFFQSLMLHPRLKSSIEKAAAGDKKAENLSMQSAFIREYQLHPIMRIYQISILIFPLIDYDHERRMLEDNIISAIEHEGLAADGLNWKDMQGNLAASEDEQWDEFFKENSKEGQEKRRENFLYARVNINDLEALAATGALHWRIIKYLRVWRYFLQDRNKAANAPRPSPMPMFDPDKKPQLLRNPDLQKEYMIKGLHKLARERKVNLLDFPRGFKSDFKKLFIEKYPEVESVFEDRWKELDREGVVKSAFAPNRKKT